VDYSKLRGAIREKCGTQEAFATAMNMSLSSLSKKLNGKSAWQDTEIFKACSVLEIPICDVPLYFFAYVGA